MMENESTIARLGNTGFSVHANHQIDLVFTLCELPTETVRSTMTLPHPSHGFGGAVLSISRQSRYAAALLYSGQSQTGYELFALTPHLQHIASFPYISAESDLTPMPFSPDETMVAVAVEDNGMWWAEPEDDAADWDTPAVGGPVEWGALFLHRIGDESPIRCPLVVDLPSGWRRPLDKDGMWPEELRFESDRWMSLGPPWGTRFSFEVPLREQAILVPGPAR